MKQFDITPKVKKVPSLPKNPEQGNYNKAVAMGRFPSWLHRKLPKGGALFQTKKIVGEKQLHTVCEESKCPNLLECWSKKTATFLIMGKQCTRACGFCDIDFSKTPKPLEDDEPQRVADSIFQLKLKHAVITMVARDDLADQGASHIVKVIKESKKRCPDTTIEVLTSDFNGDFSSLQKVLDAKPEIFNHNIETVERLSPTVRYRANYKRTLDVLSYAKKNGSSLVKSGLMVGLGESDQEVFQTLQDLSNAGCDIVTIGQYLQASPKKLRVKSFITPEQFKKYERYGLEIGIPNMYSAPFVRSSYNANLVFEHADKKKVINS